MRGASLGALWFGLLAAPLAWCAQELVGYGLAARACGSGGRQLFSVAPALGLAELIVSGAAVLVATAGLITAGLARRRTGGPDRSGAGDPPPDPILERSRFMAVGGMLLSVLFLIAILMNAGGYFLVSPCP